MAFGDTTTGIANFSEVVDIVNATAEALELEYAVMGNMVKRVEIPRGTDRHRIPYQTQTFVVQDYTDGDEIAVVQQFGIDTIDLTSSQFHVTYRISDRATRFPSPDLAAMAGDEQAMAVAEFLEIQLLSLLDDSGTQDLNDGGSTATNLGHFTQIRRMLRNVSRANGGPVKPPIFCVIDPFQEEDLLEDLGARAATVASGSSNAFIPSRNVPSFMADIMQASPALDDAFVGTFMRIPVFVSGYIGDTIGAVTAPSIGGVWNQNALILGTAKDWDTIPFAEVEWPGLIVRAMSDYGQRVGPFPQRVIQFDTTVGS